MKVKVSGIIKLYIILVKRLAKAGLVLWFGMVFILKLCLLAAASSSGCHDVGPSVRRSVTKV